MKKRIVITLMLMLGTLWAATAQPSESQSAVISLPSFHTIDTRGNVHLIVVPSDTTSALALEFNGLEPKHFKYRVKNGVLYIDVKGGLLLKNRYVRIIATTPQLSAIVSQNASVEFLGRMVGDSFSYQTTGGRNSARLNLDVDHMTLRLLGTADLSVEGSATTATMSAMGGSRINALGLRIDSLSALSSDGSEIYALVNQKIVARAQTWGTIYYGPVPTIQPEISSGGNVVLIQRAAEGQRFAEYLGVTAQEVLDDITQSAPTKMPDRGTEPPRSKAVIEDEDFF